MDNIHKQYGYIELIIGPMFSGKTSKLLELYKQHKFCNIKSVIINHTIDTRYNENSNTISTHDNIVSPCLKVENLSTLWSNTYKHAELLNSSIILINEGQFFNDLYEVVCDMVTYNKQIYICGLDGDFKRKPFGQILNLIPMCDKVTKLTSICAYCKNGTSGIFSSRVTNEVCQTVIGSDNYKPVCRNCYKYMQHH